jgi:hypothetical protein
MICTFLVSDRVHCRRLFWLLHSIYHTARWLAGVALQYVCVKDVLTPMQVETIRSGCARVAYLMASADQRLRHRWSYGAGRRPWGLVEEEW